jgi:hypothetical protein
MLRVFGPAETHSDRPAAQAFIGSLQKIADSDGPMVAVFLTAKELWVLNARNDPHCRRASRLAKRKLEEATKAFAGIPGIVARNTKVGCKPMTDVEKLGAPPTPDPRRAKLRKKQRKRVPVMGVKRKKTAKGTKKEERA